MSVSPAYTPKNIVSPPASGDSQTDKRPKGLRSAPAERRRYGWDGKYDLSAGGLIPYDSTGFWCVVEQISADPSDTKLTDVGGKYRFEDMDIDGCIAREWNEETYGIAELRRVDIKALRKLPSTGSAYIMTDRGDRPTYLCLFVNVDDISGVCRTDAFGEQFNPEMFTEARNYTVRVNGKVPSHDYKTLELRYIKFDEADRIRNAADPKWSFRLANLVPKLIAFRRGVAANS